MPIKESREKWKKENPEKYRAYKKAKDKRYREKYSDSIKKRRTPYFESKRKEAIARTTKWRNENRDKCNTISANRRAREMKAEGHHTVGEWNLLKIQHNFRCVFCRRQEPEIKLTRDHIIPLARGGSNWIENIQPLCGKCNSRKGATMPDNNRSTIATL